MEFNSENYSAIKAACKNKIEIEFMVEKSATAFSESEAPESWTAYPPTWLPPEGYVQVFIHAGNDNRGALTNLELCVHLNGGRILYKKSGENVVSLKVTWPKLAQQVS